MAFAQNVKEIIASYSDGLARAYILDWAVIAFLWALSWLISDVPVFERDFDLDDLLISHPHKPSQIGGSLNLMIALGLPIFLVVIVGTYRHSLVRIHHGTVAAASGWVISHTITEFLKNRVGRLRPDFLARCKWDPIVKVCTGKAKDVVDGRRSFPSGHSSAAFAGMTFLSLWIAGQTAAWCLQLSFTGASVRSSRLARLFLSIAPLFWATYVAVTRLEDYRHHKEDILAGSLIGILSAIVCYSLFWPSPFSEENFTPERFGRPRQTYINVERLRNDGFELTRLEEELENV